MSFLESIKAGIGKANQAGANINQVKNLFTRISEELESLSNKNITFSTAISSTARIKKVADSFDDPLKPKEFLDSDQLCIIKDSKSFTPVAKWRQNINGFPCMVAFDGAEFICQNIEELTEVLNMLLSSTNFGKTLKKIMDE